jgi:transposase
MARLARVEKLPTVWTVPDDLWDEFAGPLLKEHDPEPRTGRPRTDPRKALDGVIHVMRTGSQWNRLPREFGSDSAVHRAYQRWVRLGVFERLWAALVEYARPLGLVRSDWQSADTAMGKARLGGARSARARPTGRSRGRSGRS